MAAETPRGHGDTLAMRRIYSPTSPQYLGEVVFGGEPLGRMEDIPVKDGTCTVERIFTAGIDAVHITHTPIRGDATHYTALTIGRDHRLTTITSDRLMDEREINKRFTALVQQIDQTLYNE